MHRAPAILGEGDEMEFILWVGPLPVRWVAYIEQVSGEGFTDRQLRGPFQTREPQFLFSVLPGAPGGGWAGFPQTSLFRSWGPRLARGLWMVGDSIFPGQSTAAFALGGLRVAGMLAGIEKECENGKVNRKKRQPMPSTAL